MQETLKGIFLRANKELSLTMQIGSHYKHIYYIDKSVLPENRPLIKFIRNYIRDSSGVLSISLLVRI